MVARKQCRLVLAWALVFLSSACSHKVVASKVDTQTAISAPPTPSSEASGAPTEPNTERQIFTNPVASALSADPSIVNANGQYYYVKSSGSGILLYHAPTLAGLSAANPTTIVALPQSGGPGDNCDLWAPELRLINGAWWVYYAATSSTTSAGVCDGTDRNASHRMFVASADTANPAGTWTRRGKLQATNGDRWAIDGTTLLMPGGALYLIWSGTADGQPDGGFPQQLFIAPMSSPTALSGPRVMISSPTNAWEQYDSGSTNGWIDEGPEAIIHNNVVSIVFSANASWDNRYCLGIITLSGGDPLDGTAWIKNDAGPIFSQDVASWGTGHHTFFTSPDGTEQWIAFHSFNVSNGGWNSREVRAQRIVGWHDDGTPNLGSPVADGSFVEPSSHESASDVSDVIDFDDGLAYQVMSVDSGKCVDVVDGASQNGTRVRQWTCNGAAAQKYQFVIAATDANGVVYYNIKTANAGKCLEVAGDSLQNGALIDISSCVGTGGLHQQWSVNPLADGGYTLVVRHSGQNLDLYNGHSADDTNIDQWPSNGLTPQMWAIRL